MRIFELGPSPENAQFVVSSDIDAGERAILLGAVPYRDVWVAPEVELLSRGDEDRSLAFEYIPKWFGQVLVLQGEAIDALTPLLEPFGLVRPLRAKGARLALFGSYLISGALNEEHSSVARFSDGRIMLLPKPVFHAEKLAGVGAFRLAEFSRGTLFFTDWFVEQVIATGFATQEHFTLVWDSELPLPEAEVADVPAPDLVQRDVERTPRVLLPPARSDVLELMEQTRHDASAALGCELSAPIEEILEAIEAYVSRARGEDADDGVRAVAAVVLGDQYCRGLGWRWVEQDRDENNDVYLAVVDEAQLIGIRPFEWLDRLVSDPDAEVAIVLNYAMLASGIRPTNTTGELEFAE